MQDEARSQLPLATIYVLDSLDPPNVKISRVYTPAGKTKPTREEHDVSCDDLYPKADDVNGAKQKGNDQTVKKVPQIIPETLPAFDYDDLTNPFMRHMALFALHLLHSMTKSPTQG